MKIHIFLNCGRENEKVNDHRSHIRNLSSCEKISHLFIVSSAVQIYECSYIHFHFFTSAGILRIHRMTSSQLASVDSSIGRALHRYRRGHGFESRSSLNFFRLSFRNCLSCVNNCDDQSFIHYIIMLLYNYFWLRIWL